MGNIINKCKNILETKSVQHRDDELPILRGDGTQEWYKDGVLHRDGGMPAVVRPGYNVLYFMYGYPYRDNDLPTIVYDDGTEIWHNSYGFYRGDGPAIICKNGSLEWWKDGYTYTPEMKKL